MWLRFLACAALAYFANVTMAQEPVHDIANQTGKEWQVIYHPLTNDPDSTDVPQVGNHFGRSKRLVGAIRLNIFKDPDTGAYLGRIWLFKKDLSFLAMSRDENNVASFPLQVSGTLGNGRKRFGFFTDSSVKLSNGAKIDISGIWQHGLNRNDRTQQRIQLKWHYHGNIAAAKGIGGKLGDGPCDDDPDGDVLEEGTAPPEADPPAPPPDPTP
jgi:hypothetical protein